MKSHEKRSTALFHNFFSHVIITNTTYRPQFNRKLIINMEFSWHSQWTHTSARQKKFSEIARENTYCVVKGGITWERDNKYSRLSICRTSLNHWRVWGLYPPLTNYPASAYAIDREYHIVAFFFNFRGVSVGVLCCFRQREEGIRSLESVASAWMMDVYGWKIYFSQGCGY